MTYTSKVKQRDLWLFVVCCKKCNAMQCLVKQMLSLAWYEGIIYCVLISLQLLLVAAAKYVGGL